MTDQNKKTTKTESVKGEKVNHTPQVLEIDLGKRVINLDGVTFTGKVKCGTQDLFLELTKAKAKPEVYNVDIGEFEGKPIILNISGREWSGLVEIDPEKHKEKFKGIDLSTQEKCKILRDELTYRKTAFLEGQRRRMSARNKDSVFTGFDSINKKPITHIGAR